MKNKKVYFETYGCTMNQADSEIMKGVLVSEGHKLVANAEDSDVIVVNTCIVKTPTETKMINRIKELQKSYPNKKLVIAGCLPQAEMKLVKKFAPGCAVIGPHDLKKIVDIIDEKSNYEITENKTDRTGLPRIRDNPLIAKVPIAEGCVSACNFCITRIARGKLKSYPVNEIKRDVEKFVHNCCKEVWLTAQDCGCYGFDTGSNLCNLLREICNINKKFMVRIGMMNPKNVLQILDELIEVYNNEKVYKFLHLPLQSGSDKVLKDMERGYTAKEFLKIVKKFKVNFPELTLSTDIIVGYPTENKKDFEKTIFILKKIEPDIVNISKFMPRPNTPASELKELPRNEIKKRIKIVKELIEKIQEKNARKWKGWKGKILVTEKGAKGGFVGRNFAYKPVVVRTKKNLLGKFFSVKIIDTKRTYLIGAK